ncbi:MAG: FliI/YscN family ATPase [Mariprofundaceae bacterium]|nr:FliI/YscN family ATPase [Mariprofundaceae bacterium]
MAMNESFSQSIWGQSSRRQIIDGLKQYPPYPLRGRVHKVLGPMLEATGLTCSVGNSCDIHCSVGHTLEAEVVGFRDDRSLLMPVGTTRGIAPGDAVSARLTAPHIQVDESLMGRVLDGQGGAMDGQTLIPSGRLYPLHGTSLNPYERHTIESPMQLGVRMMDACLPMGWGQRLGLFAGAGVGKSMLLGMLARNSDADVNVIALVGERGREVREFLDISLGEEALQRSVVVVATSDTPPVVRVRAALLATTIAEGFRDKGKRVLLMMDSLTRFAQAQREIGLMLGEPPASKGYTPSCFTALAELLERAGPGLKSAPQRGDISGLYTVLVEGDDLSADPVADSAMAILDGHAVLERKLAQQGHYPAINLQRSISRLESQLSDVDVLHAARSLRKELSLYERMEDMINMGAYEQGSNPELDKVIEHMPHIRAFLQQQPEERCQRIEALQQLLSLTQPSSGL